MAAALKDDWRNKGAAKRRALFSTVQTVFNPAKYTLQEQPTRHLLDNVSSDRRQLLTLGQRGAGAREAALARWQRLAPLTDGRGKNEIQETHHHHQDRHSNSSNSSNNSNGNSTNSTNKEETTTKTTPRKVNDNKIISRDGRWRVYNTKEEKTLQTRVD